MEHSYESADALVRSIRGETAEHLVAFIGSLIGQQYSISYVCQLARHALAFGRWCEDSRISFHALKDGDIARYQRLRSRRRSRCFETRRRELHALELLMRFLRDRGVCPAAQAHAIAADDIAEEFAQSLQRDKGLAVVTVKSYARMARKFLAWRFGQGEVCLRHVRVTDASAFVQSEAKRMGPAALKNVVTALRSFLRHAQFLGEVTAGFAASVPAVASWASTPPIPRAISAEHAQRALDSCDRRTPVGRRDRAVLLLLARLGLRACEIVRLTLDDVDWDRAQLRVRGKGGRESLLPLTADVGEAIAAYLEHGRPISPDRHLFLRSMAPVRGLREGSDGIGTIVRHALNRAKADAPHRGSHQFRHALAVRMLQLGASLPEIGQVLRHRSPQSTSHYAKVDLRTLRTLAMAWPGGAR
ncbi:site-specific integrase [Cupriavidus sp. 8B]